MNVHPQEAIKAEPEWDQLSIDTPELVAIDLPLAGIGSRFVALLVDYVLWAIGFGMFVGLFLLIDPSLTVFSKVGEKWAEAIAVMVPFLLYWGYFTLFEAFWNGRTPGKWVAKIRVIQLSGRGIGLFESMTRNLLRIVDQIPLFYAVGFVFVFLTRQHQRLGDMAAGTLVVHERERLSGSSVESSGRTFTAGLFDAPAAAEKKLAVLEVNGSALQRLGLEDLEVLEGFFARRLDFSIETRAALAERVARGIQAKAQVEIPQGMSTETFLEDVARQLRDLARLR